MGEEKKERRVMSITTIIEIIKLRKRNRRFAVRVEEYYCTIF